MIEFIQNTINEPFYLWCLSTNPSCEFYKHMGGKVIAKKEETIGSKVETEYCFYFEK